MTNEHHLPSLLRTQAGGTDEPVATEPTPLGDLIERLVDLKVAGEPAEDDQQLPIGHGRPMQHVPVAPSRHDAGVLTMVALTPKQATVLAYMREFFAENDQLPTLEIIAKDLGFPSDTSAFELRRQLIKKGHLEHNAVGKYRFARAKEQQS